MQSLDDLSQLHVAMADSRVIITRLPARTTLLTQAYQLHI